MLSFQKLQLLTKMSKAAIHRCSFEKAFWKYSWNLLEDTHVEV